MLNANFCIGSKKLGLTTQYWSTSVSRLHDAKRLRLPCPTQGFPVGTNAAHGSGLEFRFEATGVPVIYPALFPLVMAGHLQLSCRHRPVDSVRTKSFLTKISCLVVFDAPERPAWPLEVNTVRRHSQSQRMRTRNL